MFRVAIRPRFGSGIPRVSALAFALSLALLGCIDDTGTEPKAPSGREAGLALRARVQGLGSAAGPFSVAVAVSYEGRGGGLVPLPVSPEDTIGLGDGGGQLQQQFVVTLDECLDDTERVQAESGGCVLWISLSLLDTGGELAGESVNLGVVRPGDQYVSSAPITLEPQYTLAITGAGTGSGVVTVPAAAAQPALSCVITAGTAAAEGCSARYPLHTTVTLTAADGILGGWGADCQAVTAPAPCELTLDGRRTASASFTAPATTGDLLVQIAGLPDGVAADVIVSNGRGYSQPVTATTTLTGLAPGDDYLVTASAVTVDAQDQTYSPTPTTQRVSVVVGESHTVQIGYNPPETGGLAVAILGLPANVGALVTVTGGSLGSRDLTAGETITGLEPGSYTVTAQVVETPDQIYAPTPLENTVTVEAGTTAQDTVTYAPTRGSLIVSVSGLPAGAQASIRVTGPDFAHDVTGNENLPLLTPGAYQVAADFVRVGGQTFAPTPASQAPAVEAGAQAVASVGYAVLRAARLEKLTDDGAACLVNTFCDGLFAVQAFDAANFTAADARVRWTALNPSPPGCPVDAHADVRADADGIARASNVCKYPTPGTYSQSATIVIDGQLIPATAVTFTFTLTPTPPSAATSSVEISLDTVRTCCDTATVTVTARDANGTPLAGSSVVLESSDDAVTVLDQGKLVTGSDGVANGRVIGRVIGSPTVAAVIDGVRTDQKPTLAVTAGIVFAANGDIYAMTQGGERPVNLTRGGFSSPVSPVWSPDGSRLAFVTQGCSEGGGCDELYVMDARGVRAVSLTAGFEVDAHDPTWSPQGDVIAFHSDPCNGDGTCRQIWLVLSTGSTNPVPITAQGISSFSPDWSLDGSKIVFVELNCIEGCRTTLRTMDGQGGSNVPLMAFTGNQVPRDPRWSPDGTKIAFTLRTCLDGCDFGTNDIAVVSSSGLDDPVNLTGSLENDASQPAWSPGGGRIAFTFDSCNDSCEEIAVMSSRDGSELTPLEQDGEEPHWR